MENWKCVNTQDACMDSDRFRSVISNKEVIKLLASDRANLKLRD